MQQTPSLSVQPLTTRRRTLAMILALAGTVLVWIPIAAPLLFALASLIGEHAFRLDWLMPAELFPLVAAGTAALVAASYLARSRVKLFASAILVGLIAIFSSAVLAQVSGLANGEIEPAGWPLVLVTGAMVIYIGAVIAIGVGGVLLLRDLLSPSRLP